MINVIDNTTFSYNERRYRMHKFVTLHEAKKLSTSSTKVSQKPAPQLSKFEKKFVEQAVTNFANYYDDALFVDMVTAKRGK